MRNVFLVTSIGKVTLRRREDSLYQLKVAYRDPKKYNFVTQLSLTYPPESYKIAKKQAYTHYEKLLLDTMMAIIPEVI